MRVVSGTAKGRRLLAPAGLETRPTADRIKESIFSMLTGDIQDAKFLDLFAGSGAIGVEALSRGAERAIFVDNSQASIEVIRKNLTDTKLSNSADIIMLDFTSALARLALKGETFDIIFLDPPYNVGYPETAIREILRLNLLNSGGIIVIEQGASEAEPIFEELEAFKIKKYGATKIIFLKYVGEAI